MTIKEIKAEIKKFEADYDEKRKELVKLLSKEFAPLFTDLFKKYPKIKSFGWTQYTPHWNDGEECSFSTNYDYPIVNNYDENYDEYRGDEDEEENYVNILKKGIYLDITEENLAEHIAFNSTPDGYKWYVDKKVGEQGYFPNPDFDQYTFNGVAEFKKSLGSISDSFYEDLFGDHVTVTLFADGTVTTEEYEHD